LWGLRPPLDAIKREQYYLDLLKPEYNILKVAGSTLGFKYTENSRTKMSASQIDNSNSKNQPNAVKIEVLDLGASPTDITTIFHSIREAGKALNINHSIISEYFSRNQKRPYKGRYILQIIRD
jgi:hypothetical protein